MVNMTPDITMATNNFRWIPENEIMRQLNDFILIKMKSNFNFNMAKAAKLTFASFSVRVF